MPSKKPRPNIVFITTDHQRFDTLFMEQAGKEITPNLNQLANEGCVFTRAYNSSPICVPARTALATGLYPTKNGVVVNDWKGLNAGDHKPIHEYLYEAGYRIGHSGMHHIKLKPELQARVPFDTFIDQNDYARFLETNDVKSPAHDLSRKDVMELQDGQYVDAQYSSAFAYDWEPSIDSFKDVFFTNQAVDFIEKCHGGSEPFALFLNIWAPHPPLAVPEPYASLYDPSQLKLPSNVGLTAEGEPINRRKGVPAQLAEGITGEDWAKTWAAHLGLTSLADDCVKLVMNALKKIGQYEDTILLFTSDHGDHLGQHNMYQKMEMYEQAIRIPMIIKAPGCDPLEVNEVVSHLDIVPTLLDYLDIQKPGNLDGISLKSVILGKSEIPERPVFSQYSGNPVLGDIRRAVITKQYKYVYDPNDEAELFDLQEDPLEMSNLVSLPRFADIKEKLHNELQQWAADHNDWVRY